MKLGIREYIEVMVKYQRLEAILIGLLFIAFFTLLLDLAISKGMYKICIVVIKVIVSIQLLRLIYCYLKKLAVLLPTKAMLVAIMVPIMVILLDLVVVDGISERYYVKNLKTSIFIMIALWMVPVYVDEKKTNTFFYGLLILLFLAACSNFIAVFFYSFRRIGLTSNPHYLALQSIVAIPVAIYLLNKVHLIGKVFLIGIVCAEFYLLLESYSRTAWFAFIIGTLVSIPFLRMKAKLWITGLIFFAPICVYYFGILDVDIRLNSLINNIGREERVTIWADALAMQKESNIYEWLLGHGLGSFEEGFKVYSNYHGRVDFTTPHNFFIELLYTSGLVGLGLIMFGEVIFIYLVLRVRWKTTFESQKELAILIIILLIMHFIHTCLTISFFAKQSAYFLAIFLGLGFYLFKREGFLKGIYG